MESSHKSFFVTARLKMVRVSNKVMRCYNMLQPHKIQKQLPWSSYTVDTK